MGNEQEIKLRESINDVSFIAESIVIESKEEYQEAAEFGKTIKAKAKEIQGFFAPMKQAAYDAHKQVCDREKEMLKPLENAEKLVKKAMNGYLMEQERIRKEEEEKARKAAQEEAERLLAKAIENNDEQQFKQAEIAENIGNQIKIQPDKEKVDGVYQKVDWEIVNVDSAKVPVEISGIEIRPVDMGAVMKLIRASKGKIKIEGIEYKEVTKTCFRA